MKYLVSIVNILDRGVIKIDGGIKLESTNAKAWNKYESGGLSEG